MGKLTFLSNIQIIIYKMNNLISKKGSYRGATHFQELHPNILRNLECLGLLFFKIKYKFLYN